MKRIEGIVQFITPFHEAAMGSYGMNDAGQILFGQPAGTKPLTRTMKMGVTTDAGIIEVPIFASNGFRGMLRRYAAHRLAEASGPVSDSVWRGLSCGAVTAKPDKAKPSVRDTLARRHHVFMGVFGGGPQISTSGYQVGDLMPVLQPLIARSIIPERYESYVVSKTVGGQQTPVTRPEDLYSYYHMLRIDDFHRLSDPKLPGAILDFEDAATNWLLLVGANRDDVKASKDAIAEASTRKKLAKEAGIKLTEAAPEKTSKLGVSSMTAVEVVNPGTPFYFNMTLNAYLSDAQIGLMLLSLQDMVQEGFLGGVRRNGCGRFVANLELFENWTAVPIFFRDPDSGILQIDSRLHHYTDAADEALQAIDRDFLAAMYADTNLLEQAA
jgi:CRISPR type IV-associated protein Csf2